VAALAAALDRELAARTVTRALMRSVAALKTFDPPLSALHGLAIESVGRAGKFIDIAVPPLHLVVHLARAGWLRLVAEPGRLMPSLRGPLVMVVSLDDGRALEATEQGTEKRLAIYLVRTAADVPGVARLGVDALDPRLDPERLGGILAGASGNLKGALSDQALIAGLGNAYSDEVLHAARLSPFRKASGLSGDEVATLHHAMQEVLRDALGRAAAVDPAALRGDKKLRMAVHGRTGQPCPECGDTIREVAFATRSLQYCPHCQTGGRVYADRRMSRLLR